MSSTARPRDLTKAFSGSRPSVLLLATILALLACAADPSPARSAEPARYQELRTQLQQLPRNERRSRRRDVWQELAAEFLALYNREKTWINRPAALFRSAVALDELARRSRLDKDARVADRRYLLLADRHKQSVLADDALFRAARLRAEVLKDLPGARQLLQRIRKDHPKGDMADNAADYNDMLAAELSALAAQEAEAEKDPGLPRLPVKRILLDPGHGGKDPGAIHNGIEEHRVALDITRRVGSILAANGYAVRYTRYKDTWISLEDRASRVRAREADIFVSIHVNASRKRDLAGFETYHLDTRRVSREARLDAVKNAVRNRRDEKIGKLPAATLLNMQNRDSPQLARSIHKATLAHMKSKKYTVQDGGVKTAPFLVLRQAGVPAVLVETGYCSNKAEARNLAKPAYRAALARGIAAGIMAYARKRR